MSMKVAIYTRCSTNETKQNVERQVTELTEVALNRGWEIYKVYEDYASGSKSSRPQLDELMKDCFKGKVQTVMISDLSRLGRNLNHMIKVLEDFRLKNVQLFSLRETIDTNSALGELFFNLICCLNQFQLTQISENVKSGLANAKRKGRKLGRRKVVSQSMSDKIWELRQSGNSYRSIGKQLNISFMSVKRELDRFYIPNEC